MPEKLVVEHCAPTLAGLKTASLFNSPFYSSEILDEEIEELNERLAGAGMKFIVLSRHNGRALIYLVRPDCLKQDLSEKDASLILKQMGYRVENVSSCIEKLSSKLQYGRSFPHEIGLFLGYPPNDVRGFMENKPCICYGLWKVYDNAEETMKKFKLFKECTQEYERRLEAGTTLEELAGLPKKEGKNE